MDNSIYTEFGKRLSALRLEKDIPQIEISKYLGIAQTTYSGYENGVRKIPLELIEKLADFFDVSPTYLVSGKRPNTNISVHQPKLTVHEIEIIESYRNHPEMQGAIDKLLGIIEHPAHIPDLNSISKEAITVQHTINEKCNTPVEK